MPRFTVPLLGSGKPGDPYRAPLPTYDQAEVDVSAGRITVSVPLDTLAPDAAAAELIAAEGDVIWTPTRLYRILRKRDVEAHFDERYQERKGMFGVEPRQ